MITVNVNVWIVLVCIVCHCYGKFDGYSVHLDPSPYAKVEEGKVLFLHCFCNGSQNPDYINWYLNNDTYGLVIEASSCKYSTQLNYYEIVRYNVSCNKTNFTLSIANISKDKDDNDEWKCDTTIIGMQPPSKASTIIKVISTGKANDVSPASLLYILVAVPVVIVIIVAAIYIKRRNDHAKKRDFKEHEQENMLKDMTHQSVKSCCPARPTSQCSPFIQPDPQVSADLLSSQTHQSVQSCYPAIPTTQCSPVIQPDKPGSAVLSSSQTHQSMQSYYPALPTIQSSPVIQPYSPVSAVLPSSQSHQSMHSCHPDRPTEFVEIATRQYISP